MIQTEQLLQEVLQLSPTLVIVLDPDYRITQFNSQAEAFYSCQKEEILHTHFLDFCQKYNKASPIPTHAKQLWEGDIISGIEQDHVSWTVKRLVDHSEEVHGFILIGNPILSSACQVSAHHNYMYLENVVANLPGCVYWKDKNGVYLGCNDTLVRMAGFASANDIIGKTDYDLCWKDHAEQWRKTDLEIMRSGVAKRVEETVTLADGSLRIEFSHKSPLRDKGGNIIGIIGTALDITRLKAIESRLQEAKQRAVMANQAKTNFLATMSHELRTPMNAIIGMAQILSQKNLPQECKEYVEIIHLSGKNLLALINDILDFSKLEAHKVEINQKPMDLRRLIGEVASSMRHLAEDKGIRLNTRYSAKAPDYIMGDSLRLRQVLVNLVGNAIKFTRVGYITIQVNCETFEDQTILLIAVNDTGIGIPSDKLNDVFERFTQVESHYSRRFNGSGLGLAISKQLIEAMGGKIGVKSVLHKGSSFWLSLPFQSVSAQQIQQVEAKQEEKYSLIQLPKLNFYLLLVEDNKMNQRVVQVMLQETGCKIDIAENGKTALEMFHKNEYDLIFMDVGLPDLDGLQVMKQMRAAEGAKSKVPIVSMTAHALEEDQQNCLKAGANEVVIKPVMQNVLLKTLRKWLVEKEVKVKEKEEG